MNLIELVRKDHMHAENMAKTLEWLRKELDAAGIPFALVGGLALRHYGYTRFTEDIGLVTTKEGLERIHRELIGRGLVPRFAGARKGLRQTDTNVSINVITAGEQAGAAGSPITFPAPTSDAFTLEGGLRIPTLETLISLKLASGQWGNRLRDFSDVIELIKVNGLGRDFASRLVAPLQSKYVELVDLARRERAME